VSTASISNDHLPLVDFRQEHGSEVDRPDPVVGLLQTDVVIDQRVRDVEQFVLEAEGAACRDPSSRGSGRDTPAVASASGTREPENSWHSALCGSG
jgi:hypothetical protein